MLGTSTRRWDARLSVHCVKAIRVARASAVSKITTSVVFNGGGLLSLDTPERRYRSDLCMWSPVSSENSIFAVRRLRPLHSVACVADTG